MPAERQPIYLLAGGRGMESRRGPDPILRELFSRAAKRPGGPRVGYLGAASGDNAVFRAWAERMFRKAGAGRLLPARLCGRKDSPEAARAALEDADIVYMSGGDVEAGMRILEERGMTDWLRALHAAGKPFFGLSAGSIMLAQGWVRWRDPDDDDSAELFACLGLAPVLCDTHGEADEWEELKALASLAPPRSVVHGIRSGAALLVGPDGSLAALGGQVQRFASRNGKVVELESLSP